MFYNRCDAYVDKLIVDLLKKFAGFWLFPDFNSEGNVRRLNNIAPEPSYKNFVFRFSLSKW